MATYVLSDIHGQKNALEALLDHLSPSSEDHMYLLGDMVDRGPDPVGVMKLCRELDAIHVLMGNHEHMMLECLRNHNNPYACLDWVYNGCESTRAGLELLAPDELEELLEWVEGLPLFEVCSINDQLYILVHAGIRPLSPARLNELFSDAPASERNWTEHKLRQVLIRQRPSDLLWIREDFWTHPTGLVNSEGHGPIVIAGHSPTLLVERYVNASNRSALSEEGTMRMLKVGACEATGGVADRIAIDCGAGTQNAAAQLLALRLDDMREFYLPIASSRRAHT